MKVQLKAEKDVSDAGVKSATGKSRKEWFTLLDGLGGPEKGRRAIGDHLVGTLKLDPWWSATFVVEYEAARGIVEKDGKPKGYTICATKAIKATPERCFAAFASAAELDGWLGPKTALDLKPGGSLSNADGNAADVLKVTEGKAIRLLWKDPAAAPGTPVEVKLSPAAGKCTVMVTHERLQTRAEADGLRAAWGAALDRLKARLEGKG